MAKIKGDHKISNLEAQRRFQDKAASIDAQMNNALACVDWERRREAEKSLVKWVNTYCIGLVLDEPPPPKGEEVLQRMEQSITAHSNFLLCLHRGAGKSCYTICTTLYAISTGKQRFVVMVANNARAATGLLSDLWRAIEDPTSKFSHDYPDVCLPFQLTNGSFRRKQLYNGMSTNISKTSSQIVLATLYTKDGKKLPKSGSIVVARGITSGIRGLKHGTMRPTMVLLDDLQTSEVAENPESVQKLVDAINKDIIPLAGKQRLSILQTATPIEPDDLVDRMKVDKSWITTLYPAIIKYPKDLEKDDSLWKEYFDLYDKELATDSPHDESLKFYKDNREAMDEGAEVFNPSRFSKSDGHISAIQKLLELKHQIGDMAFQSEYQMSPMKYSYQLDITPKIVLSRISNVERDTIPDGYIFTCASTDCNFSKYLTTTVVAFKRDMSAVVIDHFFTKCSIPTTLTDTIYNQQVYNLLVKVGNKLKDFNFPNLKWAIDANGVPFEAITSFTKNAQQLCGVPAVAMIGRASHLWNGYVRSKLTQAMNRTVLCGDAQEQTRAGTGKKWIAWDSDLYREMAQKAFLNEVGAAGSCCLYNGTVEHHQEFATQFCNERLRLVKHCQDGRNQYFWKSKEPHDVLDSVAQAYALCASQGISASNFDKTNAHKQQHRFSKRPRIKFV